MSASALRAGAPLRRLATLLALAALAAPGAAQSLGRAPAGTAARRFAPPAKPLPPDRFAVEVVEWVQGGGSGVFLPDNVLGGPLGGGLGIGSLDVLSLGSGGTLTLGFEATITDGPGADLLVFENGFASPGGVFAEVTYVEVSTDGVSFARFPSRYAGPLGPLPPFGSSPMGTFAGLCGGLPVLANVLVPASDPFDPVFSGGDAFDLADLADVPEVLSGHVDPRVIRYVRLVDVVAGVDLDSAGTTIWDHGGSGSADIDAVAVIQHGANQSPGGPTVDLYFDTAGHLHLLVHDPDGLDDLQGGEPRASVDLVPTPWATVEATYFTELFADAFTEHLVTPVPVAGSGWGGVLAVSARDTAGAFSGDQALLQD